MTTQEVPTGHIRLKRAYDTVASNDGVRILVDRLWPRGLKKTKVVVDRWLKEIAPSDELRHRHWFGHNTERWAEFRRNYTQELQQHTALVNDIRQVARAGTVTLVYSAHDEEHNQAVVLRKVLRKAERPREVRPGRPHAALWPPGGTEAQGWPACSIEFVSPASG